MARKKITADLNGGDAVTAMTDLVYQVYDGADGTTILATYAELGSEATPGSDTGVTITVDENAGAGSNGEVVLDGVEVGSATSVQIRCKDESGNESILSSASELYLFDDDFNRVIDPFITDSKWTVANANYAVIPISLNNELIFASDGTSNIGTFGLDQVLSIPRFDFSTTKCLIFDVIIDNQNNVAAWTLGFISSAGAATFSERVGLQGITTAGKVNFGKDGGNTAITFDLSVSKTIKILISGGNAVFYYWNASAWTQIHTLAFSSITEWGVGAFSGNNTAGSMEIKVDNVFVTGSDVSTQYP